MNNRNEFKEWLKATPKIKGGEYEDNTIGTYIGALDELNKILRNNNLFHADIYEISDPKQAKKVLEIYDSSADVRKALMQKRHTATKTCLRRYIEFLENKENIQMHVEKDTQEIYKMTAQERKKAFEEWFKFAPSRDGNPLNKDRRAQYINDLERLSNFWMKNDLYDKGIFDISDPAEAEIIKKLIKTNAELSVQNDKLHNGAPHACLNNYYISFLESNIYFSMNQICIIDWNDDFKSKEPYLKTKPVSLVFLNIEEKQLKDWLNLPNEIITNLLNAGYIENDIQKAYPFKPQFSTSEKIAESSLYKIVDLSLTCGMLRWCKGLLQALKIDLSKVIVKYKKTKINDVVDDDCNAKNINYWLGGASYDSGDMSQDFIAKGVFGIHWFNESINDAIGNQEMLDSIFDKYEVDKNGRKMFLLLLQMKPGDKIAIKSTNYKTGVFYIKSIGTVIKSAIDGYSFDPVLGHTIPVEWEQCTPFNINDRSMVATYSKTIHQISNQEHIDRIFYDADEKSVNNKYSKEAFLKEVYISGEYYDKIISALIRKKNIILQGAPGVGKSFLAQRLAYSIMGKKDKDKVAMIQFHQSYSYEDFVMGYKPNSDGGFELKNGVFYEFCERAKAQPNEKFYFIIDEINRGNLSKILGEIMLLIESDKRGKFENEEWECAFSLKTTYGNNGEKFFIPDNVYIIGLMNTADRSLALLDYALRRRFSFVDISPAFENGEFISYIESCKENDSIKKVLKAIKEINQAIESDLSLGKGFRIGHSYFCNLIDIDLSELEQIVLFEIFPLIEEYWIENESEVEKHKGKLKAALNG